MPKTDPFLGIVEELGEELFGVRWAEMRPTVEEWVMTYPLRVRWLLHRLRKLLAEGAL